MFGLRTLHRANTPSHPLRSWEGEGVGRGTVGQRVSTLSKNHCQEIQHRGPHRRQAARCTTPGDDRCFGGIPSHVSGHANWQFTHSSNLFLWLMGTQLEYISWPLLQLGVVIRLSSGLRGSCESLTNTSQEIPHQKLLLSECQYPGGPRKGHKDGRNLVSLSP